MTRKQKYATAAGLVIAGDAISVLFPQQSQAAGAGAGLPWEATLQTIQRSIQGPVAYVISLLALIGCGGTLVWGGEINEFLRRGILLVLVISLIIFATNLMTTLFNANGATL